VNSLDKLSDIQLINACKQGERKAQKALFDRYNRRLYAVAYQYTNIAENSKEIVQETWIQIFNGMAKYVDQGKLYGWMKTIVIRTAWRRMKRERSDMEITFDLPHTVDGQEQVLERMTCMEILDLLEEVPVGSRMVFKLFVLDDYSHKEISDHLGMKESTSRAHLSRARKILREKYFALNKLTQ